MKTLPVIIGFLSPSFTAVVWTPTWILQSTGSMNHVYWRKEVTQSAGYQRVPYVTAASTAASGIGGPAAAWRGRHQHLECVSKTPAPGKKRLGYRSYLGNRWLPAFPITVDDKGNRLLPASRQQTVLELPNAILFYWPAL